MRPLDGFTLHISRRADETDPSVWDALGNGHPFASQRWMRFGEQVMSDCESFHAHLYLDGKPASRATFWRVPSEPLPLSPLVRTPVSAFLIRRPLLICRAPLANWTGLVLPEDPVLHNKARNALYKTGLSLLDENRGSFLLFDFLDTPDLDWPGLTVAEVSDPGTRLEVHWDSFDAFLASTDKHGRQHYKRVQREAQSLGLEYSVHAVVPNIDEALPLIRAVEKKFHAAPNPWIPALLANVSMVGGIWQEVRQRGRLVGCGVLLEDNGVMLAAALGLAYDVQYAYFLLIYGSLQIAIERNVNTLRLGSGAYDVKRRLGFVLETNNHTGIFSSSSFLNWLAQRLA